MVPVDGRKPVTPFTLNNTEDIWYYRWPSQERPYHDDSTASRLLSEVKHRRAWLVLRWGTTLESRVLFFYNFSHNKLGIWLNSVSREFNGTL